MIARAQLAQNFRSKHQAALDGGNWTQAWLLCALEDPCSRRRFAAPPEQISAVSAYLKATSELRKAANLDSNKIELEPNADGDHAAERQGQGKNHKKG